MVDIKKYNMDFRPASYFENEDWKAEILSRINGEMRRKFVSQLFETLEIATAEEYMVALNDGRIDSQLIRDQSMEEKMAIGAVHPMLMGGEYLPHLNINETEIARVSLKSTTADVISIRAESDGYNFRYSVVDEYETEFGLPFKESKEPLSMREMIKFIDGVAPHDEEAGLNRVYREYNLSDDPESLRDFVVIYSGFYPELEAYYEEDTQDWIDEVNRRMRA